MPPVLPRRLPNMPRPGFVRPGSSVVAVHCRTRWQNTHGIEERKVGYPWHPWAGRIVRVQQLTRKGGEDIFRCCLTDEPPSRSLELPAWMFDSAACAPMQLADVPVAALSALQALRALLNDVPGGASRVSAASDTPVLGALSGSRKQSRGEGHAAQPRALPARNKRAARSVWLAGEPLDGANPGVGSAASARARRADHADDPPHPGARAQPRRNGGRGSAS